MRTLACFALSCLLPFSFASLSGFAQESNPAKGTGSISGRVTVGGKPVPDVLVTATVLNNAEIFSSKLPTRAVADKDGRFRFANLAPGQYLVAPYAPTLVLETDVEYAERGKRVSIGEGESADGVNFDLVRGGVITGRVTDAEGLPIISESVALTRPEDNGNPRPSGAFGSFETDDRGIYRIYGVEPGRYLVSIGVGPEQRMFRVGWAGRYHPLTYHPDATDKTTAEAVEVASGAVVTGVDIIVGRASKSFTATGRIVDADTGRPIAGINYAYGPLSKDGKRIEGYGMSNAKTDSDGRFRLEGLMPGKYAAFLVKLVPSEFYGDPVAFEIADQDLNGLEIKARRGASISGIVSVDGVDDPALTAQIPQIRLFASSAGPDYLTVPSLGAMAIGADGSFHLTGLGPGKVRMVISPYRSPRGFSLLRVERDGVEQPDGIELTAGAQISGVRVVVAYGTGVIRGELRVEGGVLPPGIKFYATALRRPEDARANTAMVDTRGRFLIEGLATGQYEVSVQPAVALESPNAPAKELLTAKKSVAVTSGTESDVVITLDLDPTHKPKDH